MTVHQFLHDCHHMLGLERSTRVADIGANLVDDDRPYRALLDAGLCHLIGLEPHPEAFEQLVQRAGPNETYLPYAVGDGGRHTLNICRYSGWTSLLVPSPRRLAAFSFFTNNAEVVDRQVISTKRMDDIVELRPIDFIKIDIQGAELMAFQGGSETLDQIVMVQTEVSFVPLYDNQPVFGEIDSVLRHAGLIPFTFSAVKSYGDATIEGRTIAGSKQLLEADVVYVRDYSDPDRMSRDQLGHLALLLISMGGFEVALRLFEILEQRGDGLPGVSAAYAALLWQVRHEVETIA